uniref:NADH dehydrogenase subunit 5 n=1 Tax=Cryptomonas gyropyrenoidosa TaxID=233257 RepID=UPI0027A4E5DD|nr:NADH dehydrogenase subunit 5 [Cryptomonas gyropyrenoidosa]WFQ82706.1 NADH dehydrogenase subunit 5 [Cryptomonas gyropyrenoidosa]
MYLLIILLPFLGFITSICFGRLLLPKGVALITCMLIFFTFLLSTISFFEIGLSRCPAYIKLSPWIDSELFDASWGILFDSLSITMCVLVTLISGLVHLYSTSYMSHDPHLSRFMSFLSLFTFFMLMLVTSDNFIQLFFGWEGVGLCSYLLINFWFTRLQANKSAIKAMVINRVGDFGLALGIFSIFLYFKTVDFCVVFSLIPYLVDTNFTFLNQDCNLINLITLLLFIGAMGKSAQLCLHTWLPDAMEGPTPVSALIHAATMVTAGIFLIIRCSPIYEYSQYTLALITVLGSTTAFFAATIGVFQNDLKKIIAYSTCSQLGYMIFACGLSNYSVSMFHVLNHAYFKALLFLSAGSIIHALSDEQDIRKMGGLLNLLPFSYTMVLIGSLALTGFPFLTGFYSKDVILEISYSKYNFLGTFAHWIGILSASLTSFYSFKLIYITFVTNPNSYKPSIKLVSDAPTPMALPLLLLSICSIFVGFLTKDLFIGLGTPIWNNSIFILPENLNIIDSEFIPYKVKLIPFFVSILSAFLSIIFYSIFLNLWFSTYTKNTFLIYVYTFFNKKWFFDKFQNDTFGLITLTIGYSVTYKIIDKGLIELIGPSSSINLVSHFSKKTSNLESGKLNQYAFLIFVFLIVFTTIAIQISFIINFLKLEYFFVLICCAFMYASDE